MKVYSINYSDLVGGAARAAYRIHYALREQGVDSRMIVSQSSSDDWTVEESSSGFAKVLSRVRIPLSSMLTRTLKTDNSILHSPAILPSCLSKRFNASDADLIHLHWLNGEMMSIADIGKIKKPVVWTLHDMWAFCGAEHVASDYRWRDGYKFNNRPSFDSGFDINHWTAMRKIKHWKHAMQIVAPSHWLASCVKQSVIMREWPVAVIPNAIDTRVWQPIDRSLSRKLLHLPPDVPLVLFGAMGGTKDNNKGFDLLQAALKQLRGELPGMELLLFGQLAPKVSIDLGFPVHYTGHLHDDVSLRLLYSAADVMVVPSRKEAFGQTASEAHACGTPVVAFNATGLMDIVEHKKTGYLATPYDPIDLAAGLHWVLDNASRRAGLGLSARERAVKLWSYGTVAEKYLRIYEARCKVT
jgi:glycosyltransferase involved in cell wall biosynthesis